MTRWFTLASLAALHLLAGFSDTFAQTPPEVTQWQAELAIANAGVDLASSRQALASWKLSQLKRLEREGNASWQEVAEQQVTVSAAEAETVAARKWLQTLESWQARRSPSMTLLDVESIGLYLPGSPRVLAWIQSDDASPELLRRKIEDLNLQRSSSDAMDLPRAEAEIERAKKSVQSFSARSDDAHLLRRAELQLRIATANLQLAKAQLAKDRILAQRISRLKDRLNHELRFTPSPETSGTSFALANVGTRLVDARGEQRLQDLVQDRSAERAMMKARLKWLLHRQESYLQRIKALGKLSEHALHDQREIDDQRLTLQTVNQRIRDTQILLQVQEDLGGSDSHSPAKHSASPMIDPTWATDTGMIRHTLRLTRWILQTTAEQKAAQAWGRYLAERHRRLEAITKSTQLPKELQHLSRTMEENRLRCVLLARQRDALEQERRRFACQVHAQHGDEFQLVQAEDGRLVSRAQFELGEALIATIGFLGNGGVFPPRRRAYSYLESATLLEILSEHPPQWSGLGDGRLARNTWGEGIGAPKPMGWSKAWGSPFNIGRLTQPNDRFTYTADWFRFEPFGVHQRPMISASAAVRFQRHCDPHQGFEPDLGLGPALHRPSVLDYRIGCPTRETFPYRSNYLYRTAFPVRGNLHATPYARPSLPFSGLGYSSWLRVSYFD